jgi:hypothetical protein
MSEDIDVYAMQSWVRAYFEEAVDVKNATDTYDKFLRQRDLLLLDINEERKTHHATAHRMVCQNEELRLANKKLTALCEEMCGKYTQLKVDMGHVQADSIIKFSTLRSDAEKLEQRVYDIERTLHRQEMVRCEQEQHERANARSADES